MNRIKGIDLQSAALAEGQGERQIRERRRADLAAAADPAHYNHDCMRDICESGLELVGSVVGAGGQVRAAGKILKWKRRHKRRHKAGGGGDVRGGTSCSGAKHRAGTCSRVNHLSLSLPGLA